jgi:hypothetical protein
MPRQCQQKIAVFSKKDVEHAQGKAGGFPLD